MWSKPHVSTEKYLHTKKIVDQFGKGIGKELHEKLLQHSKGKGNWVILIKLFIEYF